MNDIKRGDKVYFAGQRQGFTVKAVNERFAILTKPFNIQHTVIYTIVDFKSGTRNRNNFVFNPYDYSLQEDIDECMLDLLNGECQLSHRGIVSYEPVKIKSI